MVDLGAVVVIRAARTGVAVEGVVAEVVPAQQFSIWFQSATRATDYQTGYVVATEHRLFVRALNEMEVVAQ